MHYWQVCWICINAYHGYCRNNISDGRTYTRTDDIKRLFQHRLTVAEAQKEKQTKINIFTHNFGQEWITPWPEYSMLSRGSHNFTASSPASTTWISLPTTVRDMSLSLSCFCSHLKMELFSRAYGYNPSRHVHHSSAIRMGENEFPYCTNQEAQLPLRNRASATYFFVANLIPIAHSCL